MEGRAIMSAEKLLTKVTGSTVPCKNRPREIRKRKLQISPLRYPGFPVEFGGVGDLHAAFLNESRTRGHVFRQSAAEWRDLRVSFSDLARTHEARKVFTQ
jgi:hypothetical protein